MVRVRKQPIRNDLSKKAQPKTQNKPTDPIYKAYQSWIRSKGFRKLRDIMLERDGHKCCFCGRTEEELEDNKKITLQAHHRSYKNVGKGNEEELEDLITICSVCHRGAHSAKSNLRRFTDKSPVIDNLKSNPNMECRVEIKNPPLEEGEIYDKNDQN